MKNSFINHIAKLAFLHERFSFWTTFRVLIYVNPIIIKHLQNRFGKLSIISSKKTFSNSEKFIILRNQ